ncbi:hypothetical protein MMC25_002907 [Agyrium rufum]|nr:hypothetical protein [Agyrium rufum]
MQKLSSFTGQARHGWEKMTPAAFGMGRQNIDHANNTNNANNNNNGGGNSNGNNAHHPLIPAPKRSLAGTAPLSPMAAADSTYYLSFNVPFSSNLAGPEPDEILHASLDAFEKWTHPEGTEEGALVHQLPAHVRNVENLRKACRSMSESTGGRIQASVVSSEQKPASTTIQRRSMKGLVTNVCIAGEKEIVQRMRAKLLNETPIALRCAVVDVDPSIVVNPTSDQVHPRVVEYLDDIARFTGTDIFLLKSKSGDTEELPTTTIQGTDQSLDQRFRIAVYGDPESSEHAKTRVLVMIDQILRRECDYLKTDVSLHSIMCGRTRRNIRLIESLTDTAIYFPPPFPRLYGYTPPVARRRAEDEVFITGKTKEAIALAKQKLYDLVRTTKCYIKDVAVSAAKIDSIILDRLEKVRKVMETNGSYVLFPPLGNSRGVIRVQGTEILHVERTVREIMALAGQFYSASWWISPERGQIGPPPNFPLPPQIRTMLAEICTNSGADMGFDKLMFTIEGSDDSVKAAMAVIHQIPFVKNSQYQMRVKIELANEHKEFVSGKKNGKINKIMGQSNVQIIFDGFNEYNFYIDVCGAQFEATNNGLDLVEQEMPASISFHVPDQYHKRIIGIGGQHIQRIMKKYSVFVKFSNAMDRGGVGKDDDDIKVDNVICRTPARNAQSLDLVKQEIMDMVEKVDAEFVSETVLINRLYHRELIARMGEIEDLEKKWNCKIDFPSTETASDVVTISGPEYQVPQALDEFLGMVPENHEIVLPGTPTLRDFFKTDDFEREIRGKLKAQYEVELQVSDDTITIDEATNTTEERLLLSYTRNNAGGLKDAIDFLVSRLVPHGLDSSTVKGAIPRPKSDSFEESLPFFNSKLLQTAPIPLLGTDSPTRLSFGNATGGDDTNDRGSLFEKLRKPGSISSISSFLDRRKNNHSSSPGSFFKHASSNASKASLVSMESRDSGYRNVWNDSGVNLPEDEMLVSSSHSQTASLNGGWPLRFDKTASTSSFASLSSSSAFLNAGNANANNGSGLLGNGIVSTPGSASSSIHHGIMNGQGNGGIGTGFGVSGGGAGGDTTPRHGNGSGSSSINGFGAISGHNGHATTAGTGGSFDSGRPASSYSSLSGSMHNGYPAPIGPPR